jgi:anti-sigma regulatory factor (Ser/Thr protein kinase)
MADHRNGRTPRCHLVREELDVFEARRAVRHFAAELGFNVQGREELVIVVSELGSNIIKYGISGDITYEKVETEGLGKGIRVIARDVGPPFVNLTLALTDGYSDRGPIGPMDLIKRRGFGGGLGAVVRLSDSFECRTGAGEKHISVIRYVRRPKRSTP